MSVFGAQSDEMEVAKERRGECGHLETRGVASEVVRKRGLTAHLSRRMPTTIIAWWSDERFGQCG
jgi:hypothetical protein